MVDELEERLSRYRADVDAAVAADLARRQLASREAGFSDADPFLLDIDYPIRREPTTSARDDRRRGMLLATLGVAATVTTFVLVAFVVTRTSTTPPLAVVDPIVDIRSRLVSSGDVELFRMNSDTESYWRLTTLPEFDGRTFKLPSRSLDRVGDTSGEVPGRTIRQQIQIVALTDKMVPAAADVYQVAPNEDMRVNHDTGTLLKLTDLVPGEQFTIVSVKPDVTLDELRAATTVNPPDDVFLELPDDVPSDVYDIAAQVTAGATNDADKMIALQNWFRDNFEYSTEVQSGHSENAIENFLQIRKGYCEQFAATFAVMARTLGVPSRVAVGYTPGRLRADGWYSVLGKNSHAWPEIWFEGIGWIPFEPTPQRGIPGADYTGVEAVQQPAP